MKEILVLLCLVSGSLGRHLYGWNVEDKCDAGKEQNRIAGQKARLEDLQNSLAGFKEDLQSRITKGKAYEEDLNKLRRRLSKLEPSGCDDATQLQCGGKKPLCLSRLLVCDGSVDCDSGLDEKDCDALTPSGSVWIGTFVYDKCTQRRPEKIRLSIENYKVIDYLRSFPEVTASLEFDPGMVDRDDTILSLTGHMDLMPGDHVLRFAPPESDGLAFICTFDGEHDDYCLGKIVREDETDVCAEFVLQRS